MNEDETQLANTVYDAMMDFSRTKERSLQAQDFKVGVSDLGYCSERTRRMLDQQIPDESDELAAFLGTAIGDHVEQAFKRSYPQAILHAEVSVTLIGDQGTYTVNGHPDILMPGLVIDAKTKRGLSSVRRTGPDQQQQYQRHGYAKGAWEAGLLGDCDLSEVKVANVWVDRSGDTKGLHVQMEPFDPEVLDSAARWLDDVVYAYINKQEARKEPAREVCAATCGFYRTCRATDTDVQGLLTDKGHLVAVEMYTRGMVLEKRGKQMKDEAKAALSGVSGSTGKFFVRWIHKGPVEMKAHTRAASDVVDIKPIK